MDDPEPSNLFLTIFSQTSTELYIAVGILILLLFLVSLSSGTESAISGLTQKELEKYSDNFPGQVGYISKIKRNSKLFYSTILVFNTLISISIIFILSILFSKYSIPYVANSSYILIFITFMVLIISVFLPKTYAKRKAFNFSCRFLFFIRFIIRFCYPVTIVFIKLSKIFEKYTKKEKSIGLDNLSQALEIAAEDKSTSDTEQKILEGIVNFGSIETRQVMTPRIDVFALNKDLSFKEVIDFIYQNGYSRIPIYNKDIDDIIGILYAKDLIQYRDSESLDWNELLKKPYFIPENKKIDDLLTDFKNRKMHLAVIVDEYGGTSGIVTLEDVIEEIVGDINDEFDEDEINYSKIDENIYVFEGKTSVIDFCKVMDIDEKDFEDIEGDADTLAGLILEIAEEFPKRLQKVSYNNLTFQVESLDRKRLKQIKVTKTIYENK